MATLYPTADTYIHDAGGNHGTAEQIVCGQLEQPLGPGTGTTIIRNRLLFRFDLSTYTQQLERAKLVLTLSQAYFPDAPHDVFVHDLTTIPWVETEANQVRASAVLNWNSNLASNDYDTTPAATVVINNNDTTIEFDLVDLANQYLGGPLNILIKTEEDIGHADHIFTCYSKEESVISRRPVLQLVTKGCITVDDLPVTELSVEDLAATNLVIDDQSCLGA